MTIAFGNGRYTPSGRVSHGGTGSVIFCEDSNLERGVAIKFLQPQSEKRRIMDEIAALQQIRSKNVVEIYDIIIEPPDNRIGLVQESLTGQGLDEVAPLTGTSAEKFRLLYQIANGVADIHAQGLIHRDLKPNNMRLDSEGLVNIFDFDLSRLEGPAALTRGFRGTTGFAAPELYSFGLVVLDKSADVYSLAATILFLLCGHLPEELLKIPADPGPWLSSGGFLSPSILSLLHGESDLAECLNRCFQPPAIRPSAREIRNRFADLLLQDRHRAQLVAKRTVYVVDTNSPRTRIGFAGLGEMLLAYDKSKFSATWISGHVYINNSPLSAPETVFGSCVLGFGDNTLKPWQREFVTLDISHPEVVL